MNDVAGQSRFLSNTNSGQARHRSDSHETLPDHIPVSSQSSTQSDCRTKTAEAVHDFRNILNTVSMLSELALLALTEASPVHSIVRQIKVACADANDLCNRMMDRPKPDSTSIERVDLSSLVLEMVSQLTTFLPIVSSLHLDLADRTPLRVASSGEIRQVVMNLVKNAAESLGDRPGSVTVSTGLVELDGMPTAENRFQGTVRPGAYSYLAVSDTGCGMDEATSSRLFEPFFTTKPCGHGLGTASIRRIVQNNGGLIQVRSHAGDGTQIRVLFPRGRFEIPGSTSKHESSGSFQGFCEKAAEVP